MNNYSDLDRTTLQPLYAYKSTPLVQLPVRDSYITIGTINAKKQEPKIVFDGDYTIYHNEYGNKTIVKRMEGEPYDKEKAVMYAMLKSMGIKPQQVNDLVKNGFDAKAKREKKRALKEKARQKRLELERWLGSEECPF